MLFLHDVMGCRLPEGCPILQQIFAWHCITLSSHHNTVQKLNNKEGRKTMRNFTKPCINLSEYWTLSMDYPVLPRAGKAIKLNETNFYPSIQQIPKKKQKLISPHAVSKGTRTVIKSKNVHAYKIAYLKCTLNLYELTF